MSTYEITENKVRAAYVIPEAMPVFNNPFQDGAFEARYKYNKEGMFAFVSWRWINPFVEWIDNRRCLEVMAGRGILSYALRQKGVDIITTDDFS
ncbi:hypothetical protein F4V43_02310 [Paenibacillus spiritus]|uniref:Uncharacterized protein n=1 Tax=Paenibacillus spiritus TaxID=2496557 RepID=A0A5J5GGK5_9BACL|nr:hypothetical protein [Paenibacillus spiritus]KAA9007339.1 hypothetical protein F4V43_02310 [Paenibacillus spiritus]